MIEDIKSGRGPQNILKAWLLEIASHVVTDHLRQPYHHAAGEAPAIISGGSPNLTLGIEHRERVRQWQQFMSTLTEEQQDVLTLRFGQGYSLEETAALMKKNIHAAKQLQFQTLAMFTQNSSEMLYDEMLYDKLYDALEICLHVLEHGADVEACLMRFPAQARELHPILKSALQARAAAVRDVPAEAIQSGRARVLRRAAGMREHDHHGAVMIIPIWLRPESWLHSFRVAFTSVATITSLLAGGPGLLYASSGLLPVGNPYPVKSSSITKTVKIDLIAFAPAAVMAMPAAAEAGRTLDDAKSLGTTKTLEPGEPPKPGDTKTPRPKPKKTPQPDNHPDDDDDGGGHQGHGGHGHRGHNNHDGGGGHKEDD
jgi:hypothetical protein